MNEALEALLDVLYYNGYDEDILEIAKYIESNEDSEQISFPNYLEQYDCDNPIRIFWSVLVVMYGDYGTSPRFGWIETSNKRKCLNQIKSWLEVHNMYDGEQMFEIKIDLTDDIPFYDNE